MPVHSAVRRVVGTLVVGFLLIGLGFALVMAGLGELIRAVMEAILVGLFLMAAGFLTCLVGLVRFAFREPSSAELAGASPEEMRGWHFTRSGLIVVGGLTFGLPAAAMLADQFWPGQRNLIVAMVSIAYISGLAVLVVPGLSRRLFHVPTGGPAAAADPVGPVPPQPVTSYLTPLLAVAFAGLFVLGLVLALTSDDPGGWPTWVGGMAMGAAGLITCAVPRWRRRLRPPHWRGD